MGTENIRCYLTPRVSYRNESLTFNIKMKKRKEGLFFKCGLSWAFVQLVNFKFSGLFLYLEFQRSLHLAFSRIHKTIFLMVSIKRFKVGDFALSAPLRGIIKWYFTVITGRMVLFVSGCHGLGAISKKGALKLDIETRLFGACILCSTVLGKIDLGVWVIR